MSFSDYMIYGVFLREIAGYDEADHARSTVPFVKPSQGISLSTVSAIETFLEISMRCDDPFPETG
jgi:hypothetical protein